MSGTVPESLTIYSYGDLLRVRLKAVRNGNWGRLRGVEKAFFKATMNLARLRGRIVNQMLVEAVGKVIRKLLQTPLTRILQLGREHASRLLKHYGETGVFKWAPDVKNWLKDPEYLLWLGVSRLTLEKLGYS